MVLQEVVKKKYENELRNQSLVIERNGARRLISIRKGGQDLLNSIRKNKKDSESSIHTKYSFTFI